MRDWSDQRTASNAVRDLYAAECTACGVCCVVHCQTPFNIHAIDAEGIPKKLIQIGPRDRYGANKFLRIDKIKDRRFTGRQEFKKCAALVGTLRRNVRCAIYENRPRCCSNYVPGSPACLESREWGGMAIPEGLLHLGRS